MQGHSSNPSPSSSRAWVTWASVAAYAYSFVSFGLQVNLLGPTVSVLARKLGVVEADLGVIFTINGLASILGAVPSGYLVDKMPGHLVLAAALAFEVGGVGVGWGCLLSWECMHVGMAILQEQPHCGDVM